MQLIDRLGDKYQVDELAAKYEFTGRTPMTVPQALEIKEELEEIDRLLKQLEEAAKTAQIGVIDMEALAEYAEPGDMEKLNELAQQIEQYLRDLAEQQGLEKTAQGYHLTPKAYRLFQGRLLERIFSQPGGLADRPAPGADRRRRGRRDAADQALRVRRLAGQHGHPRLAHQRHAPRRAGPAACGCSRDDIIVHRTRNTPKCATVVLLDMSGSMRYDGLYINVKRMGLALDGLIRREYPGDWLQFIEIYTFAKLRQSSEDRSR